MKLSANVFRQIDVESILFLIASLFNLLPILKVDYFLTLDGSAHLYNARLVLEKLSGNEFINSYFSYNSIIVPNWFSHIYIAALLKFLSVECVGKIVLSTVVLGLSYSYRTLVKTVSNGNGWMSWFIFPFAYSFIFFLGFYNFCFGLIFLFLSLSYFITSIQKDFGIKQLMVLFILNSVSFFSHIFVFLIIQSINFSFLLVWSFLKRNDIRSTVKKVLLLLLPILPALIFTYLYFSSGVLGKNISYINQSELIKWLKNIQILIALHNEEEMFSQKIGYLLMALLTIALFLKGDSIYKKIVSFVQNRNTLSFYSFFQLSDYWLAISVALLSMYFILPDSDGSAGYVSFRLCLLFFLFVIIWVSSVNLPKWLLILFVSMLVYVQYYRNIHYVERMASLSQLAEQCVEISSKIEANKVVLPINYSDNWFLGHFSNILGAVKPMVILENYEVSTGYFPLIWNNTQIPNLLFGDAKNGTLPCVVWESNQHNDEQKIDYVFIAGNPDLKTDSCALKIKEILTAKYIQIQSTDFCKLYKLK